VGFPKFHANTLLKIRRLNIFSSLGLGLPNPFRCPPPAKLT
jgi:hypothetical protein